MKANLDEIKSWNSELEDLDAEGRIQWAWERFGTGLLVSTSFGLQSAVMLHLVQKVSKEIPIVFVDTGYLFPATYSYRLRCRKSWVLMPKCIRPRNPRLFRSQSLESYGNKERKGCKSTIISIKKEPMDRALKELEAKAWLAGLRRDQSVPGGELPYLELQKNTFKIYPIVDWSDRKTYQYLPHNGLPYHPLEGVGYDSLGDWHSTKKISEVDSVEDTRHGGHGRECGLHLELPEGLDFNV